MESIGLQELSDDRTAMPLTRSQVRQPAAGWMAAVSIILACSFLLVGVALPIGQLVIQSLQNAKGLFVGLENYVTYFQTPALSRSAWNSLRISLITTCISVTAGFAFAYALTRSRMPGREFFRAVVMVPLFAPTLLNGIALLYLFGRKGLITQIVAVWPGIQIKLYGQVGIIVSEVIYTFPQAVIILAVALSMTDARLYEAAKSLGAGSVRIFFTVTLPGVKYGLTSAFFVCFILAFTDFGAPKVVGGSFNVLATDIYKQVIGQQNFSMGAVLSIILLIPSLILFGLDRLFQKKQASLITSRATNLVTSAHAVRDGLFFGFAFVVAGLIIGFYLTAAYASFVRVWPYDHSLGFWHYRFSGTGGGGYTAFFNSIRMSFYTAVIGTAITFYSAYLIEKTKPLTTVRNLTYFLSIIPLALPGLVIGLSYIFFFNTTGWHIGPLYIKNPFHFLYATMGILVLSNIVHFYTVTFLTATTALRQLDREFESVSESMNVPFFRSMVTVTIPICLPAILEIGIYYFVSSMATVSAVIFLYSADIQLASVAIANMDDAGDTAKACAMSILIVLTNILVRWGYLGTIRWFRRKNRSWQQA